MASNQIQSIKRYILGLGAISLGWMLGGNPAVYALDTLYLNYGILGRSIALEDLETFVATGEVRGSLDLVVNQLSQTEQAQIRAVFQATYDVDPVLVSRFAYTASGEQLLHEAGDLIQTETGQNGDRSLRAALVLAAANPEGLSLINFLRHLPTDMRLDLAQVLQRVHELTELLDQMQLSLTELQAESEAIARSAPAIDWNHLPDLRQPGTLTGSLQTLVLTDTQRDRSFTVDLYIPQAPSASTPINPAPLIVVSNGLGARRDRFEELTAFWVSHGFAVAVLDHPGSDRQRLQEFYQGLHHENFEVQEFIDRPLDISFLLDELERLNAESWGDRLNLDQVGVFGYSFGGTTALALGGATMDFEHLAEDCATRPALFNISLLYQCRALELPQPIPDLYEPRIDGIYVFVPFGRSLYGSAGIAQIDTPIFWEATDQDILTPLVVEQLPTFQWLTIPDRYLAVTQGLPHARLTLDVLNRFRSEAIAWDEIKPITEQYHQVLSLIFFQVYVAGNEAYQPYLNAQYAQSISQPPYTIHLMQSLTDSLDLSGN